MRSTLWAIWLLVPDPFFQAAEHPAGHLAIGTYPFSAPDPSILRGTGDWELVSL